MPDFKGPHKQGENDKPDGKEKHKPHDPAEFYRKASEHLRQAADHNDNAAKLLASAQPEQAAVSALKAHANQIEATHHLNEAIKHHSGLKKKEQLKEDAAENAATSSR